MKTTVLLLIMVICFFAYPQYYSPLAIGNVWVYNDNGTINRAIVNKDTTIDNISYFVVNSFYLNRYRESDSIYIRYDKNSPVIEYQVPYYKKYCKLNDTWKYPLGQGYWYTFTVEDVYPINKFGRQVIAKLILRDYMGLNSFYEIWTDEFGRIGRAPVGGVNNLLLLGCIIDGIVYGDTTYITNIDNEPTAIKILQLYQNYPNPFNPTTTIRFNLPEANIVTLKIYDILGNEISTLVNEFKQAGNHLVTFEAGKHAAGLYTYRIKAGNFSESKKMILLK